ncbi:MAG TPA: hypothetical protein PK629_08115 [Oscillospiraceae bacterium]|nr:hypothetical protein [Oscillospiraceae bacterium]HPF55801.1 hypothetical protein [Clostridiales bacterium]HPK35423.1 hypothetical protein [Oscillospiraceae bacterium]HPR75147.1 hypothetical protein [Oscillospiraceae bacterium]
MASLKKRQGLARMIIRRVVCSVCAAVMLFSAVMACTKLDQKADILDDLYSRTMRQEEPYINQVAHYRRNARLWYASSDLGTFISQVNFDLVDQIDSKYNEISIFTEQYHLIINNLPKDTDNYFLRKVFSTFDSQYLFDMWLAGFQKASVTPYLEQIRAIEGQMFGWYGIFTAALFVLLLVYAFTVEKGMFNRFMPKGEKSSTGAPLYLLSILNYLTFGIVGLIYFFIEKKSRYVKQAAVQTMLLALITVVIVFALSIMYRIFSYMFPPVQNITQTIRLSIMFTFIGTYVFGLLMTLAGRVFQIPILGKLSVRSSYCD